MMTMLAHAHKCIKAVRKVLSILLPKKLPMHAPQPCVAPKPKMAMKKVR